MRCVRCVFEIGWLYSLSTSHIDSILLIGRADVRHLHYKSLNAIKKVETMLQWKKLTVINRAFLIIDNVFSVVVRYEVS